MGTLSDGQRDYRNLWIDEVIRNQKLAAYVSKLEEELEDCLKHHQDFVNSRQVPCESAVYIVERLKKVRKEKRL